ncbi:ATP-binding cassette domain-containing protein, partial [Mesorhizobium sp. M2D.F.Ca.ET.206.01.1.1]|uniref:ATP-binding cassette domain-containing protein n=1 Tax=Mesorhizobium sp. M2D.F.Ca.ET.206.01.1.1 TaxID=2563939 RepID=UPI001FE1B5D4
ETKIAFLAGGIGITPFRSMLQYLIDRKEWRPIVILYATERQQDIAYRDVLGAARQELGIKTIPYNSHPAIHHLNGAIRKGSLTAVVGANGSGNSTLMKGIVGVLKPMAGEV